MKGARAKSRPRRTTPRAPFRSSGTGRWKSGRSDVRVIGDAVISAFFAEDKPKAREKTRAERRELADRHRLGEVGQAAAAAATPAARASIRSRRSIGRSSFRRCLRARMEASMRSSAIRRLLARTRSSPANRKNYLPWLQTLHEGAHGNCRSRRAFLPPGVRTASERRRLRADRHQHDRPGRHARHGPGDDPRRGRRRSCAPRGG